MKKLALGAVVLSVAAAASAQSSVTLFGVIDTDISIGRGSIADRTQLSNSGNATSRIGFRGVEDLGGGLSASFWLEAGLNTDNGTGQPTNTNNQAAGASPSSIGLVFGRRATVSLAGGWGELRLGRDYTPQYWNLYFADPFGNVGVGLPMPAVYLFGGFTGPTAVRAANTVTYFLPGNLGGLFGSAQYYLGENLQDGATTEDDGTGAGVRVGYASGPVYVSAATSRTNYAAGDTRQSNIVGTWDFGIAKVGAQISRDKNGVLDGKGWLLGGWFPVGPGQILGSYSRYETTAPGNPEGKKLALGYVHHLSKRTALYTTWARLKNGGGASLALNGATTGPNTSSSGLDLGVRHSF